MVGLDVTHQVILPVSLFADMAAHHQHPAIGLIACIPGQAQFKRP
jgi:hypothetical protein